MYKTFALYKEERSFDVLQGTIPYFVYGDVKLAIKVNGEKQTSIPEKIDEYVVQPTCDNDATIEWDYENWGPIIKNITKETRCSLNFVKNNNLETLGRILNINNLSIETLLTDANIETLTKSKSGMTYLAKSPDLVKQMQDKVNNYSDDIKKKILDSEVISEDMKYEAGLPCYLLKDNKVLKAAGDIVLFGAYRSDSISTLAAAVYNPSYKYMFQVVSIGSLVGGTKEALDTKNYTKLILNYGHAVDHPNSVLSATMHFGMTSSMITNTYDAAIQNMPSEDTFNNVLSGNLSQDSSFVFTSKESTISGNSKQYFLFSLKHNGEVKDCSAFIKLKSIALY